MFLRFIPGVLWLDILDDVTDQCQATLMPRGEDGWRWPCSLAVILIWMSILGEIRVQAVKAIIYIRRVYYEPNRTRIQKLYGQWQVRLALCTTICGLSYYVTFEFADDFPYLHQLKEDIQNDKHNEKIDESQRQKEVFLMAHVFVQRFLQQAEAFVWILSTFLKLKRKRFIWLMALVWVLRPMTSMLVQWCGNFALWLLIGHAMIRAFDLTPSSHPRLGTVGCTSAVMASTIYWRKYGTMEILVALGAAIAGELAWQRTVANVQEEKKRKLQAEAKPGIFDRVWGYATSFFTPEEDEGDDATVPAKSKSDKEDTTKGGPVVVERSKPPFYAWLGLVVYWAAIGIRVDGYDLFDTL